METGGKKDLGSSPPIAGRTSLADILFSARPAFIWNGSQAAVTWMNPAARLLFECGTQMLTGAITPKDAAHLRDSAASLSGGASSDLKLKLGRQKSTVWSVEPLELTGGANGLIVSEASESNIEGTGTLTPAAKPSAARSKAPTRKPSRKAKRNASSAPTLTDNEHRSLKAIGRAVRKLCHEKQPEAKAPPRSRHRGNVSPRPAERARAEAFLAGVFDLVLYLDESLEILRCDGRPQCFGWHKASLQGKPVANLFAGPDQATLGRLAKKCRDAPDRFVHETLLAGGQSCANTPCRAALALRPSGEESFVLALLSLKIPQRLKKYQVQAVSAARGLKLAA